MVPLAIVVTALVLLWAGSRAFARMDRKKAARWARIVLGLGAMGVGAVLTLRGLAIIGAPIAILGLGLAGIQARPGAKTDPGRNDARSSASMSRAEALGVLGLQEGASEADIRKAHRELMKRVHPDAGGSADLTRRIQQARDILLG